MKCRLSSRVFRKAFATAAAVVPARTPRLILKHVKLSVGSDGAATLYATDGEVGIRLAVDVESVDEPGAALLPADRFGDVLRHGGDADAVIESDDSTLTVRIDRSAYTLQTEPPGDYPDAAEFPSSSFIRLDSSSLTRMFRSTLFACDASIQRYALGGVFFERPSASTLAFVATDGRRLARDESPVECVGVGLPGGFVVPARAAALAVRVFGGCGLVDVASADSRSIAFRCGGSVVSSLLLDGLFPAYDGVFPRDPAAATARIAAGTLRLAVAQASITADLESSGVTLRFSPGELTMTSESPGVGASVVTTPLDYDGADSLVVLNPAFVAEAAASLEPDAVVSIEVRGRSTAVVMRDDPRIHVLMPINKS